MVPGVVITYFAKSVACILQNLIFGTHTVGTPKSTYEKLINRQRLFSA
jgi:hypothetical protein